MKNKKILLSLLFCVALLLSSCSKMDVSIKTVGKNNTTAKKIALEIEKNLNEENADNKFVLYGMKMSVDVEGIGKAKLYFSNKLSQDLKYSDITVVTVDTRTGKIDSPKSADFISMGVTPYEYVVNGAPLMLPSWKKDSEDARKIAENTFYQEDNFVYNYVEISARILNGVRVYEVSFISFVNRLQYSCVIDGMSGQVISSEIIEM